MSNFKLDYVYFPNPFNGAPIFNGKVFIGESSKDPQVLENRIPVTIVQQDGIKVIIEPASQPLTTGAGGVLMYNGSPIILYIDQEEYSFKVLDHTLSQIYYKSGFQITYKP